MTRLTSLAMLGASLVLATPAFAQGQAEIAARLNEEGKQLMYAEKYAEAAAKFRDASARAPEAKYFFNLCTANFQLGKFDEALTACNAAENHSPTADQSQKISKLVQAIGEEAKKQGIELHPTGGGGGDTNMPPDGIGGGDPNTGNPDPTTGNPGPGPGPQQPMYQPAVGRPPSQGLFTATTSDNKYTWTLGVDLFGGGGKVGDGTYGNTSGGIRLKSDYVLNAAARLGAQGYFQYTGFAKGEDQGNGVDTLGIADLGVALYKHFCLPGNSRLCITPLGGVHLALMAPQSDQDGLGETVFNYTAFGVRLEASAHYAFGSRMEHVLAVALGTNVYSGVVSESMDAYYPAGSVGLDEGGAAGYLSVGYTYRFNTPIGRSPFVTLE